MSEEERIETPDSAGCGISVFQNYSASDVFVQGLAGIVNQGDVEHIIRGQKQMLQRFEKTNEMLLNCNALTQSRLKSSDEDFKKHIKMMAEMKKDLDYIFRKIRTIKTRINTQYPDAFQQVHEDDNEDEEDASSSGQRKDDPQVEYEQMVLHSPGNPSGKDNSGK